MPIPVRYSDISLTLAHSVKYAISAFLNRRLVQRCCNFCRSCFLLCLNFSFEQSAYLITWHSDAAPVNSRFYCHLYSQISRAPLLWRHQCVIGKENDRNTDYRYGWNVPTLPADTDYRSDYQCNSNNTNHLHNIYCLQITVTNNNIWGSSESSAFSRSSSMACLVLEQYVHQVSVCLQSSDPVHGQWLQWQQWQQSWCGMCLGAMANERLSDSTSSSIGESVLMLRFTSSLLGSSVNFGSFLDCCSFRVLSFWVCLSLGARCTLHWACWQ